jgi:hypothetical protein
MQQEGEEVDVVGSKVRPRDDEESMLLWELVPQSSFVASKRGDKATGRKAYSQYCKHPLRYWAPNGRLHPQCNWKKKLPCTKGTDVREEWQRSLAALYRAFFLILMNPYVVQFKLQALLWLRLDTQEQKETIYREKRMKEEVKTAMSKVRAWAIVYIQLCLFTFASLRHGRIIAIS